MYVLSSFLAFLTSHLVGQAKDAGQDVNVLIEKTINRFVELPDVSVTKLAENVILRYVLNVMHGRSVLRVGMLVCKSIGARLAIPCTFSMCCLSTRVLFSSRKLVKAFGD